MKSSPTRRWLRAHRLLVAVLAAMLLLPIAARATAYYFDDTPRSWSRANWDSIGSLPPAHAHPDARVLVLTARTGGWRGVFAVHSWIVLKPAHGERWTRYDVVGWGSPIRQNGWAPDGRWRGNDPVVVADVRGAEAERLIPKIEAAVQNYPWRNAGDYRAWPGPNSNTFIASVLRAVPELAVALPGNAIGRDYRPDFHAGLTDSGTGVELNLWGYAGIKAGWVEGVELNFLGLVVGIDVRHPALTLPGYGRLGLETLTMSATAKPSGN